MRFARIEVEPTIPLSFEAALNTAGGVEVDSGRDSYRPVAGVDEQVLIVNRAAADGTIWTAVAGVTPQCTALRVVFINGSGQRGRFDLPHGGGTRITELQSHRVVGLVLAAPRDLARRLCCGDVVLDRLIEAAWQDGRALELTEAQYAVLERRLVAADPAELIPLHRHYGTPALGVVQTS